MSIFFLEYNTSVYICQCFSYRFSEKATRDREKSEKSPNSTVVDAVRGFLRLFIFFALKSDAKCGIIMIKLILRSDIMRIRMFPDKNDGDWGLFPTILCFLGIIFPPLGILLLIIAWSK